MKPTTKILTAAILIGGAVCAEAGDLKVIDHQGLTRLLQDVDRPVQLSVKLDRSDGSPNELELSSIYGFGPPVKAERKGDSFEFSNVPEGVWEIRGLPSGINVISVKVATDSDEL